MDDDETTPEQQSAFDREEPPHAGADEDPEGRTDDLSTEELGEGGPAGA